MSPQSQPRSKAPKIWSERRLRLTLNAYPPFFFLRVRCTKIGAGFHSAQVVVKKSLWTRNLNGTTFGGAIFTGADPVYALLYWQVFARRGVAVEAWLESAAIRYRRPARSRLTLSFELDPDDIAIAAAELADKGHFRRTHTIEAIDETGTVCATAETVAHVRI